MYMITKLDIESITSNTLQNQQDCGSGTLWNARYYAALTRKPH